jgi:hypothetical protein
VSQHFFFFFWLLFFLTFAPLHSKPPAREPPKYVSHKHQEITTIDRNTRSLLTNLRPTPTISTAKSTPTIAGTATTKVTPSLPARGRAAAAAAAARTIWRSRRRCLSLNLHPFVAVPPEPAAPNEPPDIDDLDAMVSSLDQFASGVDDDKIDILSKDDPPPPRGNNTWVAANQSKPIASKPRSSAISHGSAGSPASPSLARTSRVASNLANSSSNNNAPPSSTPPTSAPAPPPVTRSASQQDATASQQQKQNTLVKLSSKIFQNRASSGQAPTPVAGASSSSATNAGSSAPASGGASGDNVSPRLLSPRAPADTSAARPLAVIGKPEPDETLLATADRYRKMSCAISDLTKKQHQQMQNVDQHAQLVAKVLQKAEKQSLTPAPISSQTAAMVQRLSTLSVVTAESTARAYDGMGKTVDTIDSVRASSAPSSSRWSARQFDAKVAKFLKDKEKSQEGRRAARGRARSSRQERERLDESVGSRATSTLREVCRPQGGHHGTGFLSQLLESLLAQARAQAALDARARAAGGRQARGSMASRRRAAAHRPACLPEADDVARDGGGQRERRLGPGDGADRRGARRADPRARRARRGAGAQRRRRQAGDARRGGGAAGGLVQVLVKPRPGGAQRPVRRGPRRASRRCSSTCATRSTGSGLAAARRSRPGVSKVVAAERARADAVPLQHRDDQADRRVHQAARPQRTCSSCCSR